MDSNYPQFADAAENPRAGVFHQVVCTSCIIICSRLRTSISLYASSARDVYYAIRQPARTACCAGVHTRQASSSHRRALEIRARRYRSWVSSWCVRIKRKCIWWISCACRNAGGDLPGLLGCAGNWSAHDWRFETSGQVTEAKSIDLCAPYGDRPYLKSLNGALSH